LGGEGWRGGGGPVNLKGSAKSDEAFSFTGVWIVWIVWIADGTAANVRTGREMRLACTLPRLIWQNCSVGYTDWQQTVRVGFGI